MIDNFVINPYTITTHPSAFLFFSTKGITMKKINKTQCICEALNKGMKVTPLVAWKLCKTFTLAEIIRDLRKRYGMNIVTEYVTENGCRYGVYHLAKRSK